MKDTECWPVRMLGRVSPQRGLPFRWCRISVNCVFLLTRECISVCARARVERRRGQTSPPSSSGSLVRPHRYVFVVPRDGPSASAQRARASGSARGPASRSTCFAAPASMPRASDRERAAHGAMETTRGRWDSGSSRGARQRQRRGQPRWARRLWGGGGARCVRARDPSECWDEFRHEGFCPFGGVE